MKISNFLHRTWRPKTLSGLFYSFHYNHIAHLWFLLLFQSLLNHSPLLWNFARVASYTTIFVHLLPKFYQHKMFEQSVDLGAWIMPKIEKKSKCIIIKIDIISNQLRYYKYELFTNFLTNQINKKLTNSTNRLSLLLILHDFTFITMKMFTTI